MRIVPRVIALSLLAAALGLIGCNRTHTAATWKPSEARTLPGSTHPAYTITDLGVGVPQGINGRSQIIGHFPAGVLPDSSGLPLSHGCLWEKGRRTEMPTLGGWYSRADGISDGGQILGTAMVAGPGRPATRRNHACLWDGRRLTDLDADARFRGTSAAHITKSGAVYAASPPQGPRRQFHLWLYPAGFGPGVRRDLGVIGGPEIEPLFINDAGMVVGTWATGEQRRDVAPPHTFAWHRGDRKWMDLETSGTFGSEPTGLNDAGQVTGVEWLPDAPGRFRQRVHAFLWGKGRMQDLGTLPGGDSSRPYAVNNHGQVVGYSDGDRLGDRPVLWENGHIKDLTEFIPSGTRWIKISKATGINDRGQIVGDGSIAGSADLHVHGYLLTPL